MMKPKEATPAPTKNPEETKEGVKEVATGVEVRKVEGERDKMFEKNPRSKASIKKHKKDKKKHHKHEEKPSSTSD